LPPPGERDAAERSISHPAIQALKFRRPDMIPTSGRSNVVDRRMGNLGKTERTRLCYFSAKRSCFVTVTLVLLLWSPFIAAQDNQISGGVAVAVPRGEFKGIGGNVYGGSAGAMGAVGGPFFAGVDFNFIRYGALQYQEQLSPAIPVTVNVNTASKIIAT